MSREEWEQELRQKRTEWGRCFCCFIVSAASHSLWEAYDGYVKIYKGGRVGHDLCKHGDILYWENESMRLKEWLSTQLNDFFVSDYIDEYNVPNYLRLFMCFWNYGVRNEMNKVWYVFSKFVIANKVRQLLEEKGASANFKKSDVLLSTIGIKDSGMEQDKSYIRDAAIMLCNIFSEKGEELVENVDWMSFLIFIEKGKSLIDIAEHALSQDNQDEDNRFLFYTSTKSEMIDSQTKLPQESIVTACRIALDTYRPSIFNSSDLDDPRNYFQQSTKEIEQGEAYYTSVAPEVSNRKAKVSIEELVCKKVLEIYRKQDSESHKGNKKKLLAPYYVAAIDMGLMLNDWDHQRFCEMVGIENIITESDWRHYIPNLNYSYSPLLHKKRVREKALHTDFWRTNITKDKA